MGLFSGVCGVAFSAWLLSRGASRYQHLLASLEEAITQHLKKRVPQFLDQKHGYASSQFDVISGLSGMGAYLLCRRSQPPVAEALTAVLHALILLSEDEQGVPHWFTPPALMSQEQWRGQFPDGLLDSGLAHGIAGPLALLALAKLEDVVVEGMDRALERMSTWLVEHRLEDDWGINWPCASPPRMLEASQTPLLPARTAWCYGAPGIARALWLSGQALHQEAWCDLALTAMQAVYRKPGPARQVDAPTFCHGVAGLLQITLRFARETGLPLFQEAAESLTRQLLELYEPGALFGFLDLEPGERRIDQAGLLTGAAGTTLVLLSAATSCESAWDRLFLLA
jgi:lantibiotic modifying enzyme